MNGIMNSKRETIRGIFHDEQEMYPLWEKIRGARQVNGLFRGINPGILNSFEGPDYQGAEFEYRGRHYHGDVEIHIDRIDWYRHNHHLNPLYNAVVLHLAWLPGRPVETRSGRLVPTLSLRELSVKSCGQPIVCPHPDVPGEALIKELAACRLKHKINAVADKANHINDEQLVWRGFFNLLGLPHNRGPFEALAEIISPSLVRRLNQNNNPSQQIWQALCLGAAGIPLVPELKPLWDNLSRRFGLQALPRSVWRHGGIRPMAQPRQRLLSLAQFLYFQHSISLDKILKHIYEQRIQPAGALTQLQNFFRPKAGPRSNPIGLPLIREMAGNLFLPFLMMCANRNGSSGFSDYLETCWFELPPSSLYRLALPGRPSLKSNRKFYYQQGIIELQQRFCERAACNVCPLQKKIDKVA